MPPSTAHVSSGVEDDAGIGSVDRRLLDGREIESEVDLLVDLLVIEEIGPAIREARLHL